MVATRDIPGSQRVYAFDPATDAPAQTNAGPQSYVLLSNASATGPSVGPVRGGDYIWSVEGTFGGATVALERQSRAGTFVAFSPAASLTAPGQINVGVGHGAIVRATVTGGTPSALFSDLAGLS